jgi:hypothetical protein
MTNVSTNDEIMNSVKAEYSVAVEWIFDKDDDELSFDIEKVYDWYVEDGFLCVTHNEGDDTKEYCPNSSLPLEEFLDPDWFDLVSEELWF